MFDFNVNPLVISMTSLLFLKDLSDRIDQTINEDMFVV